MSTCNDDSDDCSKLLDRNGPTYGISFTRTQADDLFRRHLNQTINSFECNDTGYNNLIFFIDTVESTERYALKVIGRYWIKTKTEAEVKALNLLAQYTTIPVPKVLAFSSDRNNEYDVEWILMTRIPGISMRAVCEAQELSLNAKKSIILDLVDYIAQIHFRIPRFDKIGAFTIDGEVSADLYQVGPCSTYEQFVRGRVQADAEILKKDPIFAPIRNSMLDLINEFDKIEFPSLTNFPIVFSHGDLDAQNILISIDNPESPRITGIVDWEWAGSYPCSEEYFTSYDHILHDHSIREFFLEELEKRNVLTPRTIEKFSLLEKFHDITANVALWELTDLVNPEDPRVQKKLQNSLSIVKFCINELKNELKMNDK